MYSVDVYLRLTICISSTLLNTVEMSLWMRVVHGSNNEHFKDSILRLHLLRRTYPIQ